MRVLLIGDLNSSFVRDYALNLKTRKQSELQIDLFATITPLVYGEGAFFEKVFSYRHFKTFESHKKLRTLYRTISLFMFLLIHGRRYKFIHIHYVLVDFILISLLLKVLRQKTIITVYGSDFYKISSCIKWLLTPLFRQAVFITFANESTGADLSAFYGLQSQKIKICRFGLAPLEKIREIETLPLAKSRELLELPLDRLIIAIGYNFNMDQQHFEILQSIAENQNLHKIKDTIIFLLPLTYGTEPNNKQKIFALLKSFPYSVIVFSEFLAEEELAHLRKACDIMIQVQKKDQFSGSMQEHLFAGSVVITGSWLPYKPFKEAGIYFRQVDKVSEIGDSLYECITHLDSEKEKSKVNSEVIYQMSSWNNTIDSWIKLYNTNT
jgi:hypothetical protein